LTPLGWVVVVCSLACAVAVAVVALAGGLAGL
jgi:hypothetical protein